MKNFLISLGLFLFISYGAVGQSVSCSELLQYVVKNGRSKATVNSYQLFDSSWLKEVKAYSIENSLFVVATIKRNEYDFTGQKYIFCGIPSSNWSNFYNGLYDLNLSYGERFHKYIFKYQCECN